MIIIMKSFTKIDDVQVEKKIRSPQTGYLSLGMDMTGVRCLIVGGGRIAARKTTTLLGANASVTVLSPAISEGLSLNIETEKVRWIRSEYRSEYLDGYDFVIAATSDPALNIEIGTEARRCGKLYCVVSSGRFSQVIFPAAFKNDNLTVAVHSNGTNCRRSKAVRDRIKAYVNQLDDRPEELAMFGFDRTNLSREDFSRLKEFENTIAQNNPIQDKILVLATCRRWECYVQNGDARQSTRDILSRLENFAGTFKTSIYYKNSYAAYYHLLNICLGLDSPLTGETEIVNQIKDSVKKWIVSESSQLYKTFSSAILSAKKIRQTTGLIAERNCWALEIASLINKSLGNIKSAHILVVGNGNISRSLINKLIDAGHEVVNFSRHIEKQNSGYPIYHTDKIENFLNDTDVLVICSELTPKALVSIEHYKKTSNLLIIDIEGYGNVLGNQSGGNYFGFNEIPQIRLTADEIKTIADARLKTVEQTLVWYSSRKAIKPPCGIIRIGARQSLLSKTQIAEIRKFLKTLADHINLEEVFIDTPCDRDKRTPLPEIRDNDFFTRDIDQALLEGRIDIAVHSAKDLPQKLVPGLTVIAVMPSIASWDCLVSKNNVPLKSLPQGAIVGTSSVTRKENLTRLRPDIKAADIRGNVPDRIKQLDTGKFDALILACAGLIRLGLTDRIAEVFSEKVFPSTLGQGSLALVARNDDIELMEFLKPLDLGRSSLAR